MATERALQIAIEALIDAGAAIAADRRLGLAPDEAGIIERLRKGGALSDEEAAVLADLRRFRNVPVHQYGNLDTQRVHRHAVRAPAVIRGLTASFRRSLKQ